MIAALFWSGFSLLILWWFFFAPVPGAELLDMPRPDYKRIYELEVELGLREPLDPNDPKQRAEMRELGLEIPLPNLTPDSTRKFQETQGLVPDGMIGPETAAALQKSNACRCKEPHVLALRVWHSIEPLKLFCSDCGGRL